VLVFPPISATELFVDSGAKFDLDSKFLIDVWDKDTMTADDFIGYRELTLRELLKFSISKAPIDLSPPPPPHKQNAGKLVVDVVRPGFPQVWIPTKFSSKERIFSSDRMLLIFFKKIVASACLSMQVQVEISKAVKPMFGSGTSSIENKTLFALKVSQLSPDHIFRKLRSSF
jgi:hypothetical protein